MFQFTTTTIINSAKDSNGTTDKYTGTASAINVTRVGRFLKNNIVSIHKRAYSAGAQEQATIVMPSGTSAATSGRVIRLVVDVRLSQNVYSEYASAYLYFKKPIIVEVISSGNVDTDGAALVAQISGLKDRFGESYITATYTAGSDTITLTAKDNFQRFKSIAIVQELTSYNTLIQPEYETLQSNFTITIAGKVGFGDDAHMIKSLMIPTYENTRHFGTNKEERPILGGNYTQYTIRYKIEKEGDGIVAAGNSITTHVFYVLETLKTGFEAALTTTFPGLITIGGTGSLTIAGDEVLDLSNGETTTLVASGTNTAITWSSNNTAIATVSVSGLVTPVATGTAIMTATAADGKTGTFTITVVA